ncbi:hypothetical protein MUK42_07121 [Musa troglodytarum]|uniref:Uncharacterized protein n=1 Tax=Musa troglodytarum TaxID=320322 RepID=A0A9E7HRU5_9LILI|nr:hypothetical protein MUK42_07121 [Musa troglodytarum]
MHRPNAKPTPTMPRDKARVHHHVMAAAGSEPSSPSSSPCTGRNILFCNTDTSASSSFTHRL